jgi:sugar phosphate isomerase/epimerase
MAFTTVLQIWSVRDQCSADLEGTLKKVSDIGYKNIEFYTTYGHSHEEFKKILDAHGLHASSAHVSIGEFEAGGIEKVAESYASYGVECICIPYLPGEAKHAGGHEFPETLMSIKKIALEVAKYNITLTYHNHGNELAFLPNGVRILDVLYGSIPKDYLQCQLEVGWLTDAGADPIEYVRKYSGRVAQCHLKDFTYSGKLPARIAKAVGIRVEGEDDPESHFVFMPVGQGVLPIKGLIPELEKAGCRQLIIEQDCPAPGQDIFEGIEFGLHYLQDLLK